MPRLRSVPRKASIEIKNDAGEVIGLIDARGQVHQKALGGLDGTFTPWGSIGGDAWEWLHRGQVQEEYRAVGKEAPSTAEIAEGAAQDAYERAQQNISQAVDMTGGIGRWIVIGLVAYAAIQLLSHIPKPRN